MPKIDYARSFASSDEVTLTLGGLSGAFSDTTVAAIIKPTSGTGSGTVFTIYDCLAMFANRGTSMQDFYDYTTFQSWSSWSVTFNTWLLIAWTKPTGSSVDRVHSYDYSARSWSHVDYIAQPNLTSASGTMKFGNSQFGDTYIGLIACVGIWKSKALSDSQLESLASRSANWLASAPTSMWLLNQPSSTVPISDLVGSSHQSAITGTTASAVSDLPFDVTTPVIPGIVSLAAATGGRW